MVLLDLKMRYVVLEKTYQETKKQMKFTPFSIFDDVLGAMVVSMSCFVIVKFSDSGVAESGNIIIQEISCIAKISI